MLYKTQGIVLHSLPYKDVYTILHIYTKDFGRVSYMVARKRGKRSSVSQALFMPLSVLDLEVEHQNKRDIQRIKEVYLAFSASSFQLDPVKNVLALFLSEVLFRVVKDTQPDERMYAFLTDSVRILDSVEQGLANFHVAFLLNLLHYLGIFPNVEHPRDALLRYAEWNLRLPAADASLLFAAGRNGGVPAFAEDELREYVAVCFFPSGSCPDFTSDF